MMTYTNTEMNEKEDDETQIHRQNARRRSAFGQRLSAYLGWTGDGDFLLLLVSQLWGCIWEIKTF